MGRAGYITGDATCFRIDCGAGRNTLADSPGVIESPRRPETSTIGALVSEFRLYVARTSSCDVTRYGLASEPAERG